MDNPCGNWLADQLWDNITELAKLANFHGIIESFEQYPRDWHAWFQSAEPETASLPGWAYKLQFSYKNCINVFF
jgi:dynein heavy chain